MDNKDLLLKDLTGKDSNKAQNAADYLINNSDIKLFQLLVDKSDFLFPFIRDNVCKRIENSVTKSNFTNIINFFDCYSPYYDDLFASILAKHANEDLTDRIFELLETGNVNQKTYCAKYFAYIPDTVSIELLSKYAFCDDEYLSANSAEALGQMQDDVSFDIALENLELDDDFEKLKAVKFFCAYGRNFPLKNIFRALKKSSMPENIAGQIPYMESVLTLLESDLKDDTLTCVYYLILGLGEILPLSDIFQFEIAQILERLANSKDLSSKTSLILLSALSKFKLFCENEEYLFDEDKETKKEVNSILHFLQSKNNEFWQNQKKSVLALLNGSDKEILAVLNIISDYKIIEAVDDVKKIINSENETVICEALSTLKSLNKIEDVDLKTIANNIHNTNIKILIENMNN